MKTYNSSSLNLLNLDEIETREFSHGLLIGTNSTHRDLLGILRIDVGSFDEQVIALRLICVKGEEPGLLLPSHLQHLSNSICSGEMDWTLEVSEKTSTPAKTIEIELGAGQAINDLAKSIQSCSDLDGRLFYIDSHVNTTQRLEINGGKYLISKITPSPQPNTFIEIVKGHTNIEINVPSGQQVIDVVILADVSGSMGIKDLTNGVLEGSLSTLESTKSNKLRGFFGRLFGSRNSEVANSYKRVSFITRAEAVKRALNDFLEFRQKSTLTKSRIALIKFAEFPRPVYPELGFAEVSRQTSAEEIEGFRNVISELDPENSGTKIGSAIQYAAGYFNKHSRPEHRKLIVLLSDGADYTQRNEEDTGRVIEQMIEEPVHLAAYLYSTQGIEIQPIGISTPELYSEYSRREREPEQLGYIPNHELLKAMIDVSGGRAVLSGNAAVLEEYFRDLARGIRTNVSNFPVASRVQPDSNLIRQISQRGKVAKGRSQGSLAIHHELANSYENFESLLHSYRIELIKLFEGKGNLIKLTYWDQLGKRDAIRSAPPSRSGIGQIAQVLYFMCHESLTNELTQGKSSKNRLLQAASEIIKQSEFRIHLATLRHKVNSHGHVDREDITEAESQLLESNAHKFFMGAPLGIQPDEQVWESYGVALIECVIAGLREEAKQFINLLEEKPYREVEPKILEMIVDW